MKAQSGRRGMAPVILNLSTSCRWVVVNITPSALSPQGKNPGMHWIGGWVTPQSFVTFWRREQNVALVRNWTPNCPVHSSLSQGRVRSMSILITSKDFYTWKGLPNTLHSYPGSLCLCHRFYKRWFQTSVAVLWHPQQHFLSVPFKVGQ